MGFFGDLLGSTLGHIGGSLIGHGDEGRAIGKTLGGFLPFKKGGKIKKQGLAYLHKGEVVLPKKQVQAIGKLFHSSPTTRVNAMGKIIKKARK